MKNLEIISKSLEGIRFSDFNKYVEEILTAFLIPNSTIQRLISQAEKEKPILVYRRAAIINNQNNLDRHSIPSIETSLSSINRILILANEKIVICKDSVTDEIIEFEPSEIHNHVSFFIPLIYGKTDVKELTSTLGFAELVGRLYNLLCVDEENDYKKNQHHIIDFILSLIYASFIKSITKDVAIKEFFSLAFASKNNEYKQLVNDLFEAIYNNNKKGNFHSDVPFFNIGNYDEKVLPNIKSTSFELTGKILCYDLQNIDPEILGSLIYKLTQDDDAPSIYGHYTSFQNVSKVLNPLFIFKYEKQIEENKKNEKALLKIRTEILNLTFFDPTNGPGCFLSSAFNGVSYLISSIDSLVKDKQNELIKLNQFVSLVDNSLAMKLSHLTLWVSYIQYLSNEKAIVKKDIETAFKSIQIFQSDQLKTDWEKVCPNNGYTIIIGSPVFKGAKKINAIEKSNMQKVFGTASLADTDYSSCWLFKLAQYITGTTSHGALVITNSICQGVQVPFIWNRIYKVGCEISFAYRSFKWKNSISHATGVSVIIIGLTSESCQPKIKTLYAENKIISTDYIGPYLVNSTKTIVSERTKVISNQLPLMQKGNMPYDNQNLLLTKQEKNSLVKSNPLSTKYLKRIVGSKEFIQNIERWCLWIPTESLNEAQKIEEIAVRIENVKNFRLSKTDKSAKKLAARSHQFREFRSTISQTLVIPSVSSENRPYIPIGFIGKDTIVSNLAFAIYNCEPWIFGLICSRIHMVWIRTVCGSLETRLRYSSGLGYNTFPFPQISAEKKAEISALVFDIVSAREMYSEGNLGDLYNNMPENLRMLHNYLDKTLDSCYRVEPFESDTERIKLLFDLYEQKILSR